MRRTTALLPLVALVLVLAVTPARQAGAQSAGGQLSVTFAAVDNGDGAVYRGPCGELGVFDTPRTKEHRILAVLDAYGSRDLAWLATSHYHHDHMGGLPGLAAAPGVSVDRVYDRGGGVHAYDSPGYRRYHAWATSPAIERRSLRTGDTFALCSGEREVSFEVVSAGRDGVARGTRVTSENDQSLCLRVTYRDFSHATCGDLNGTDVEYRTDMESVVAPAMGSVDVAQVNHHGSAHSSNHTWVGTLSPAVAVVSRGANPVGPLHPAVAQRWRDVGADVYLTQDIRNQAVHGNITVTTGGTDTFSVFAATGSSSTYPVEPEGDRRAGVLGDRLPDLGVLDL